MMQVTTRVKSKVLVAVLTLLMVFGNVASLLSGAFYVYGADKDVSTWALLKKAIEEEKVSSVEITNDLYAGETITVSTPVTITGKDGQTIYQKQRESYETMFKVVEGGELTLGEKLTLSGKTSDCATASLNDYYNEEIEVTVPSDAKAEKKSKSSGKGKFTFENGNLGISGMSVMKTNDAYDFEVKDGYLKANVSGTDYFVDSASNGSYMLRMSLSPSQSLQVVYIDPNTGARSVISSPVSGETYYIYDPNFDGLLGWDGNYIVSQNNGEKFDAKTAIKFSFTATENGASYWVVPGTTEPQYDSEDDPELVAAMEEYNNNNATTEKKAGWVINGENYFDETEAQAALDAIAPPSQDCDSNDCTKYTNENFESGSTDAPHGFFVQVEDKGIATLDGAVLENFNTSTEKDKTPKHVAPVVANGAEATFDVVSGSIQNNIVGYIVDDSRSGDEANAIKIYVKGAAPNAVRKSGSERRGRMAGIDGNEPGSGITGTAGAVIYANKAQGTISGGSLEFNRGDTGAVMVTDKGSSITINDNADINNNVGAQFGGGVTVENGGAATMDGGQIRDNVAWFGGGAVFATENGIDWLMGKQEKSDRTDGEFTLLEGEIFGNHAFTRGGGFLVDSDGVTLLGGKIHDNTSRVIGGAAYVMGDHPDYSYTLSMAEGNVYNNEAVTADTNVSSKTKTPISKKLKDAKELGCAEENDGVFGDDASGVTDDLVDFVRVNDGTGGGIWTCAYGTTVLDLSIGSVTIHDNEAAGATGDASKYGQQRLKDAVKKNVVGGQDLHADNGGSGSIIMLPEIGNTEWSDENTGNPYVAAGADPEIRNLTNGRKDSNTEGVQIYNNASRRGGGIGADGTLILGPFNDVAQIYTDLKIEKVWKANTRANLKPIMIEVSIDNNGEKVIINELEMDGKPNSSTEESVYENAAADNKWSGGFNLPVSVDDKDGNPIPVFKIVDAEGNNPLDPTDNDDMVELAKAIQGGATGFKLSSDVKITFRELVATEFDADGNPTKYEETDDYIFEAGEINISDFKVKSVKVKVDNFGTTFVNNLTIEMPLSVSLANDAPEIEKYVNEAVHKEIDLTETFKYDIIAYVTKDADEVVITDELNENLAFASTEEQIAVANLGEDNNHKVTNNIKAEKVNGDATVAVEGTDITAETEIVIDEQRLTVTIPDAGALRGCWVKVTFEAKIAEGKTLEDIQKAYKEIKDAEKEDRRAPNTGNDPVVSDEDHKGVPNKASYEIYVNPAVSDDSGDNTGDTSKEPKHKDESNTVTVKPKDYKIKISKQDLGDDTKELPGAEITVTGPAGFEETWVSGEKPHELSLTPGEYELKEVVAPEGYNNATVTTTIKFTVGTDGKVTINGATEDYNGVEGDNGCKFEVLSPDHLVLKDTTNPTIKITKSDLEGKEVAGAEIEIRDSEGNVVEKWTSEEEPHSFKIQPGEYELVEVVAPEGYNNATVTTTIKFTVDYEGNVKLVGATEEYNGLGLDNDCVVEIDLNSPEHIILKDSPYTDVSFSKKALGGEELEGAKMQLTDSKGIVIDEWTSTKESHDIKLPNGEYTLIEKVAPEGYYCVTTEMKFEVKGGKVTLKTAKVDNAGKLTLMDGNNIVLEDAPIVQGVSESPVEEEGEVLGVSEDEVKVKSVKTGDDTSLYIWAMALMMTICMISLAVLVRMRRAR